MTEHKRWKADQISLITKTLKLFLAIGAVIGALYGGLVTIDSRYASARDLAAVHDEVQGINERLDQKIISDQIAEKQRRIWDMEDRFEFKKMPDGVRQEIRNLQSEIDDLKKQQKDWLDKTIEKIRK